MSPITAAHPGCSSTSSCCPWPRQLAPHAPKVKRLGRDDRQAAAGAISTTLPGVRHFETLLAAADAEIDWPVIDETSAYSACYTTGTTGRPKGIYYSHRGIYLHTLARSPIWACAAEDTVMLVTPMFHGQCWGLPQAAVRAAAKVVLPGRYTADDPKVLVDAMIAEQRDGRQRRAGDLPADAGLHQVLSTSSPT